MARQRTVKTFKGLCKDSFVNNLINGLYNKININHIKTRRLKLLLAIKHQKESGYGVDVEEILSKYSEWRTKYAKRKKNNSNSDKYLEEVIINNYISTHKIDVDNVKINNKYITLNEDLSDIIIYRELIDDKYLKEKIDKFILGGFKPSHSYKYSIERDEYIISLNNENLLEQLRALDDVSSCFHIVYGDHKKEGLNYIKYSNVIYITIKKRKVNGRGKIEARVPIVIDEKRKKIGFISNIYIKQEMKGNNVKKIIKDFIEQFIKDKKFKLEEKVNIHVPKSIRGDAGVENKGKIKPISFNRLEEICEY